MLSKTDVWKLQDAKARFSEVVRRARVGEPQQITVHGKEAVAVVDTSRFDIVPRSHESHSVRSFLEESKKFRLDVDFDFDQPHYMEFPEPRPVGKSGRRR
jgi:antitoxin Phd